MQHHPEIERNLIRLLSENITGKSILDIGFGKGAWGYLARNLPGGRQATIDGIEVYGPDAKYIQALGVYDEIFMQDVTDGLPKKKYDYVFCFEVLEHLTKQQSEKLLSEIEKVATRAIFISTPNGRNVRGNIDNNSHSAHLCGWKTKEFTKRGYKVEDLGFRFEPRDHSQPFWYLGHYGFTPITRFFPQLSNTLFAYKYM